MSFWSWRDACTNAEIKPLLSHIDMWTMVTRRVTVTRMLVVGRWQIPNARLFTVGWYSILKDLPAV